jgi:cytochrome c556
MKHTILFAAAAALFAFGAVAQEAEDPFADAVEMRHGLMLQMATDAANLGGMAKGELAYDAGKASRSAANIAAIVSVLSMDQFPAGSEYQAATDSYALPAIWATPDDFLAKIADLNSAAGALFRPARLATRPIASRKSEEFAARPSLSAGPHKNPVLGRLADRKPVAFAMP